MSLLRDQLGMRPTDARRVIRKAPEILAPRADGSTAQEAADVRLETRKILVLVPYLTGVSTLMSARAVIDMIMAPYEVSVSLSPIVSCTLFACYTALSPIAE